jgi:hypothetical protein
MGTVAAIRSTAHSTPIVQPHEADSTRSDRSHPVGRLNEAIDRLFIKAALTAEMAGGVRGRSEP